MPLLSAFTPCGALVLSSKPSRVEQYYRAIISAFGGDDPVMPTYDFTPGTHMEAKAYAWARGLSRMLYLLDRAGNQTNALKCVELLPLLEQDYLLIPSPKDIVLTRQQKLFLRMSYQRGALLSNIVHAMRLLVGQDFLAYIPAYSLEQIVEPASPETSIAVHAVQNLAIPPKFCVLQDPVCFTGSPIWVQYGNLDPTAGEVDLVKGDVVMVQPDNSLLGERVLVDAVAGTGSGRAFEGVFQNPHDIGAAVTTSNWPVQWSTARMQLLVVAATSSADRDSRRQLDEEMGRRSRGISQWAVVQPTTPDALTTGPTTLPWPLGLVPVGQFPFTRSP